MGVVFSLGECEWEIVFEGSVSGNSFTLGECEWEIQGVFFNWYPPKSSKYKQVNLG